MEHRPDETARTHGGRTDAETSIARGTGEMTGSSSAPAPGLPAQPVLSVRGLHVRFRTGDGILHAVKGIDLDAAPGETVAIVGESGSGKSQTMMSVMGLLASNGWAEGSVRYRGEELVGLSPSRLMKGTTCFSTAAWYCMQSSGV